jgi:outer membrane protein OmpA-like peptidoglycan-associated protein
MPQNRSSTLIAIGVLTIAVTSCSASVSTSAKSATSAAEAAGDTTIAAVDTTIAQAASISPATDAPVTTDTVPAPSDTTSGTANPSADPPGSQPGLDDVDGDGRLDPTCGTLDLGAGLVVRTLCTPFPHQDENGLLPVPNGVLSLAAVSYPEVDTVDVTARFARTTDGSRATFFELGSDTLFDTGKAVIRSGAELALQGVVTAINDNLSGGAVLVRGHADSRGSATANMTLSEQRATAIGTWLTTVGSVNATSVTPVGLGNTQPAALEKNPDGSVSDIGQAVNRRVEIVVVTPN